MPEEAREEAREVVDHFDAAMDQALEKLPVPKDFAVESNEGGPSRPALRTVAKAAGGAVDESAADGEAADAADDPVAAQIRQRLVQQAAAKEKAEAERTTRSSDQVNRYADFIKDVETNPALRDHILKFWQGDQISAPAQPQQAPQVEDDPLAGYAEQDRKALSSYIERREAKLLQQIQQIVAPFHEQLTESAASREFSDLAKAYPDWETWTTKKELAEIRQQFPNMNLVAAFRLTGFDKVRAKVSNATRQMATVKDVLSRQAPAESQPRRHVRVDKREMSFDEGFEKAYAQVKAAVGSPGR